MPSSKTLFWITLCIVTGGTLFRLWPILGGQAALAEFFITEDGYLLLTVARNMGQGLGMSVSEGTIPTNGVQPLITFLFTLPYLATEGDKVTSLIGVHVIHAAIALACFFAIRAFARRVLEETDNNPLWPTLIASLWFLSPILLKHSMNGLETGLYTLMIVLTLLQFIRVLDSDADSLTNRLLLGALCGLTFLARNDGAFLVVFLFGLWFLHSLAGARLPLGTVLARLIPPGLVSLIFAAPWLAYNKMTFGSIVPVSGTAQSMAADFGQNAYLIPTKLLEYLFPMLPVPGKFENTTWFILAALVAAGLILAVFMAQTLRRPGAIRIVVATYFLQGVFLASYYGFFFGAPHFVSRYLAPLAPLLTTASVFVALTLAKRALPQRGTLLLSMAGLASVGLCVVLLSSILIRKHDNTHTHFQVVNWVQENVTGDTWVGAVQTGTLGYWHDRTINLDGKVNPAALEARRTVGDVLAYVVESDIDYLADWIGIAGWAPQTQGGFADTFELIVEDRKQNLAVLRRKGVK